MPPGHLSMAVLYLVAGFFNIICAIIICSRVSCYFATARVDSI